MTTALEIAPLGVPPYSIRGAVEDLQPIDAAAVYRRTINGVLVDLGHDQFHKFKLTISCTDQQPPALDGVWPGQEVTVYCITELCFPTLSGSPARYPVSGSQREEGAFTFYRPVLDMIITAFTQSKDEYSADISWSIELEEI